MLSYLLRGSGGVDFYSFIVPERGVWIMSATTQGRIFGMNRYCSKPHLSHFEIRKIYTSCAGTVQTINDTSLIFWKLSRGMCQPLIVPVFNRNISRINFQMYLLSYSFWDWGLELGDQNYFFIENFQIVISNKSCIS